MTVKKFYQSPETETIVMPLEGVVCSSQPDASNLNVANPFGTEEEEEY